MPAMSGSVRHGALVRGALAVVWLLIAAVIAVGGAGLAAGLANQPGTPARAELTLAGDRAADVALDDAQAELVRLTTDVERLGELGRGALTALVASDFAALDAAVAEGETLARSIDSRSATLREQLSLVPGTGPREALLWSDATRARRDTALAAVDATRGLELGWSRLAAGATVANRLTVLLTDHDKTAGAAAAQGRARKYAQALKTLATATAKLDEAKALRDVLANTVDVSTLTQWIDRNAEYDAALARLYQATIAAKGAVTKEFRDAFAAERRAQALLPANTSGLVIILAEIGRGGLNQAVIAIEEARAQLQQAIDLLDEAASPEPAEGGS